MSDNDDDVPSLSVEALKALQEFYDEQTAISNDEVEENWQLSQFWYTEDTSQTLAESTFRQTADGTIALVSCPTLYKPIKNLMNINNSNVKTTLFEYDKRFATIAGDEFVFYDYTFDSNKYEKFKNSFDTIVIDPPFLSEECLRKVSQFVDLIKKDKSKLILCTGAVMEELAEQFLKLRKCQFKPQHKNNLANEFICLTNFGEL